MLQGQAELNKPSHDLPLLETRHDLNPFSGEDLGTALFCKMLALFSFLLQGQDGTAS